MRVGLREASSMSLSVNLKLTPPFDPYALPRPWLGTNALALEVIDFSVGADPRARPPIERCDLDAPIESSFAGQAAALDSYALTACVRPTATPKELTLAALFPSASKPDGASSFFTGAKNLLSGIQIQWGEPAHHAFIAGASSLITGALWWSLFLYGGNEQAKAFAVLLSALVPQMVVGGFLSSLLHDTFQITLLEKTLKPWLAKAVKTLKLDNLIRSLKGNQGMPDFDYVLKRYRLTSIEYELSLHLLIESRRELLEGAKDRELTGEENAFLKSFEEKISNGQAALKEEQDKLSAVGMGAVVDPFSRAAMDGTHTPSTVIPGGYLTFLASTAATVGAFVFASGPPRWTENTQALFMYFGIEAFFGMIVGYVYGRVVMENVMGYIVRPFEARVNRMTKKRFFPGVADELALPEPERLRNQFDRSIESVRNYAEFLNYARYNLADKTELTSQELERLAVWADCLKRAGQMVSEALRASGR